MLVNISFPFPLLPSPALSLPFFFFLISRLYRGAQVKQNPVPLADQTLPALLTLSHRTLSGDTVTAVLGQPFLRLVEWERKASLKTILQASHLQLLRQVSGHEYIKSYIFPHSSPQLDLLEYSLACVFCGKRLLKCIRALLSNWTGDPIEDRQAIASPTLDVLLYFRTLYILF